MATVSEKINNKANKSGAGNGEVVVEKETVGDGFIETAKRQPSAKADAQKAPTAEMKAAAEAIDRYEGLDTETLVWIYRTMYLTTRRSS
jgi:hypothetical protein